MILKLLENIITHMIVYHLILHILNYFSPGWTNLLKHDLLQIPPRGWMAWGRFMCNIDYENDIQNAISENLFIEIIDAIILKGLGKSGYQYVCIDDCWASKHRNKDGDLVADLVRFPRGISYLVNYAHSKNIKIGMYLSYGKVTCMGHTPGSQNFLEQDARLMAKWNIDYLKVDGCFTDTNIMYYGYPVLTYFLANTGKNITLSYSWPFYQFIDNIQPDYRYISKFAHTWRNYYDIAPHWASIKGIIEHFGQYGSLYAQYHGPNSWFDLDQLMIGNPSVSSHHALTQMAFWCFLSAPLLMSNDLRDLHEENNTLAILTHPDLLALNRDPLGVMGLRVVKTNSLEIWVKLLHSSSASANFALLFYNNLPKTVYSFDTQTNHQNYSFRHVLDLYCQVAKYLADKCLIAKQYQATMIKLPNFFDSKSTFSKVKNPKNALNIDNSLPYSNIDSDSLYSVFLKSLIIMPEGVQITILKALKS